MFEVGPAAYENLLVEQLTLGLYMTVALGLLLGFVFGLVGAAFGGITGKVSETSLVPNQGIHLSLRNSMLAGLVVGLASGTISFVLQGMGALGVFCLFGLLAALWFGGLDVIQHIVLRLLLFRRDCFPWDCTRFLDFAHERILLRKVGGGYIFIHRLLQEYFAALEPSISTTTQIEF